MAKLLTNWRIVVSGDRYCAPEIRRFHLQGEATWVGKSEPDRLTSSPIVRAEEEGWVLVTRSGTRYDLGVSECSDTPSFEEMIAAYPGVPLS